MNLREWVSNSAELMERIPEVDRGQGDLGKILGLKWDLKKDTLLIPGPTSFPRSWTLRQMTKVAAQYYDPLGVACPVLHQLKKLIQEAWILKLKWDEAMPLELIQEWTQTLEGVKGLSEMPIPRYLEYKGPRSLHVFCDASKEAYGACVYVVTKEASHLVFAKSKLAPIKKPTIPRLELMAAQIGAQLLKFVMRNLDGQYKDIVLWSDSKAVLYWYAGTKQQSVFVENRLKVIREGPQSHARYVPTAENPADVLSRGCSTNELENHKLWWNGPRMDQGEEVLAHQPRGQSPSRRSSRWSNWSPLPCIGSPGGSLRASWRSARASWRCPSPRRVPRTSWRSARASWRCPSPRRVPTASWRSARASWRCPSPRRVPRRLEEGQRTGSPALHPWRVPAAPEAHSSDGDLNAKRRQPAESIPRICQDFKSSRARTLLARPFDLNPGLWTSCASDGALQKAVQKFKSRNQLPKGPVAHRHQP